MAENSAIEWTESTWNPVTGCTKISPGCKHCYAERMAARLRAMGQPRYKNGFALTTHPDVLDQPLRWRSPRMVFVGSMSDLFHQRVPREFVIDVFEVMRAGHWHTFQVLTKRSRRLALLTAELPQSPNTWLGVSVESVDYVHRIDDLRSAEAAVKFVSLEPLLGPLPSLDLKGIDWVIVGGESGPGARPMKRSWVLDIQRQCRQAGVPFFFKQWGGVNKKRRGRLLDGQTWDAMPPAYSVRGDVVSAQAA